MQRKWTEEENQYIRDHYKEQSYIELAFHLHTTEGNIQTRINRMGIHKTKKNTHHQPISEHIYEKAEQNGISRRQVQDRIHGSKWDAERACTEPIREYDFTELNRNINK